MIIFIRMNLNAHLRSHFGFRSRFTNLARFPDVMRERFLAIDMLAMLQRQHGRKSMCMLAGAHDYCVEILRLIEELAEVSKLFGVRMLRSRRIQVPRVNVAERHDVLRRDARQIASPASARGDHGNIELIIHVLTAQESGPRSEPAGGS